MLAALLVPWEIRVLRLSLVLICCSTWLYITSCWVNSLESIGLVGSWFFSWVVSKVRKVEKLLDRSAIASGWLVLVVLAVVAGVDVAGVTVMALSFRPGCPAVRRLGRDRRCWLGSRR